MAVEESTQLPPELRKEKKEEKKEDTDLLSTLKARREVAQKFTKPFHDEYDECVEAYEFSKQKAKVRTKYPLIYAFVDFYESSILPAFPAIFVKATEPGDVGQKYVWQGVLAHLQDILKVEDEVDEAVSDFIMGGAFVLKCDWLTDIHKEKEEREEEEEAEEPVLNVFGKEIGKKKVSKKVKKEVEVEKIDYDNPFVERVSPKKIFFAPETDSKDVTGKAPYIVEEMIKPIDWVKKKFGIEVEATEQIDIEGISLDEAEPAVKADIKRAKLWWYHGLVPDDKTPHRVLFYDKKILEDKPNPHWHGKPPYIIKINHRKYKKFQPRGDVKALIGIEEEYNDSRAQISRYRRRCTNPKYQKLAGTQVDEKSLRDPDTATIVTVNTPGALSPLVPPKIDSMIFRDADENRSILEFISGILMSEEPMKAVKTATGQTIMMGTSNKKMDKRTRIVLRGIEELFTMLMQLTMQYWDEEKIFDITGELAKQIYQTKYRKGIEGEGEDWFYRFNPEDFEYEPEEVRDLPDVSVDISPTANKELYRAQLVQLLGMVNADRDFNQAYPEVKKTLYKMIFNAFENKEVERIFMEAGLKPQAVAPAEIMPGKLPLEGAPAPTPPAGMPPAGTPPAGGMPVRIADIIGRLRARLSPQRLLGGLRGA